MKFRFSLVIKLFLIVFAIFLIINLVIFYLITSRNVYKAKIPSSSMENTIMENEIFKYNVDAYKKNEPARGEIIVFRYPDNEEEIYCKRIVALPGETLEIIDGLIYINGNDKPLEEKYLKEEPLGSYGPYEVPQGHYFVLGDNRNYSHDSRFWVNKYVSKDKIIGKAIIK